MNTKTYSVQTSVDGPGVSSASIRGQFGFPDLAGTVIAYDLVNESSACRVDLQNLIVGDNTITVPDAAGAVVIMPPDGSTSYVKLKGVGGDTGFYIHRTAPTFLALDETVASFVLNASTAVTGLKLIWV